MVVVPDPRPLEEPPPIEVTPEPLPAELPPLEEAGGEELAGGVVWVGSEVTVGVGLGAAGAV
jgi:hypothetical protein